jgi:hypothetical protein
MKHSLNALRLLTANLLKFFRPLPCQTQTEDAPSTPSETAIDVFPSVILLIALAILLRLLAAWTVMLT